MNENLSLWEMAYISQLIYRINSLISVDLQVIAELFLSQLQGLIPFRQALMAEVSSGTGPMQFINIFRLPRSIESPDVLEIGQYLNNRSRPVWQDYMEFPWSSVFLASSVQDPRFWIDSPIYKTFYEPQGLYYALHGTFIRNDIKLGMLTLLRAKEDGDFTERELYFMELLKPHLELHLFRMKTRYLGLQMKTDSLSPSYSITIHYIEKYNLTHREVAVVNPILNGVKDAEVCRFLGITQSTLDKHLHNIYRKTGATSRASLFQKFKN